MRRRTLIRGVTPLLFPSVVLAGTVLLLACSALFPVYVRIQYDLLSDRHSAIPVPRGDVEVFFESDSLRDAASEINAAGATGAWDAAMREAYAGTWEADTIPVPTVYDSVATLTAVSELQAVVDSLTALGEVGEEDPEALELTERLLAQGPYDSSPGEMIDELRRRAGELGANAIIVTAVSSGTVHALAIRAAEPSGLQPAAATPGNRGSGSPGARSVIEISATGPTPTLDCPDNQHVRRSGADMRLPEDLCR